MCHPHKEHIDIKSFKWELNPRPWGMLRIFFKGQLVVGCYLCWTVGQLVVGEFNKWWGISWLVELDCSLKQLAVGGWQLAVRLVGSWAVGSYVSWKLDSWKLGSWLVSHLAVGTAGCQLASKSVGSWHVASWSQLAVGSWPIEFNCSHEQLAVGSWDLYFLEVKGLWDFICIVTRGMSYHLSIWVIMNSHMMILGFVIFERASFKFEWDFICIVITKMRYHHPIWVIMNSHTFLSAETPRTMAWLWGKLWDLMRLHMHPW